MRKLLLLSLLMCGWYLTGLSQDIIQNFDDWTTASCGTGLPNYDNPNPITYWATLNELCNLGQPIVTVTKTTDAMNGTAALLRTQILGTANSDSTPGLLSRLIPGLINSGKLNASNITNPLIQGQPYTGRPTCFRGYYKYFPIQGDSAAIYAELFKGGNSVGIAAIAIYNTVNTYTMFDIPFVYANNNTPDSINIVFASSAGALDNKGRKGSRLFIDEAAVLMSCPTSITDAHPRFVSVYPNPAQNELSIQLNDNILQANLEIYDTQGRLLQVQNLSTTLSRIDISALATGHYHYKIQDEAKRHNRGTFTIIR